MVVIYTYTYYDHSVIALFISFQKHYTKIIIIKKASFNIDRYQQFKKKLSE